MPQCYSRSSKIPYFLLWQDLGASLVAHYQGYFSWAILISLSQHNSPICLSLQRHGEVSVCLCIDPAALPPAKSGTEVPKGTLATPPDQHGICARNYAYLIIVLLINKHGIFLFIIVPRTLFHKSISRY